MGWALTLIDCFASEYGWSRERIMWGENLGVLMGLYPCIGMRYGQQALGPTLEELEMLEQMGDLRTANERE